MGSARLLMLLAGFSRLGSGVKVVTLLSKADCCTAQRDFFNVPISDIR
jgi:hypothetical protein